VRIREPDGADAERRRGRDILRDVVDEDRIARAKPVLCEEMLEDRGLRLQQPDAAGHDAAFEQRPEVEIALDVVEPRVRFLVKKLEVCLKRAEVACLTTAIDD
jgi:hypothetical protein